MRFTRVTLFFIAFIITLGFYQLALHFLSEVEPQISRLYFDLARSGIAIPKQGPPAAP